jgi:hypothetical protein
MKLAPPIYCAAGGQEHDHFRDAFSQGAQFLAQVPVAVFGAAFAAT